MLALLSASIPLAVLIFSTLVAVDFDGNLNQNPSPVELSTATSLHVLAFSSHGRLLVAESEGSFDMETWERVTEEGSRQCRDSAGSMHGNDDVSMDLGSEVAVESFVRTLVGEQVATGQQWKEALR